MENRALAVEFSEPDISDHENDVDNNNLNCLCTHLCLMVKLYIEASYSIFVQPKRVLKQRLIDHGLYRGGKSDLKARYLLLSHFINGLCTCGSGTMCESAHGFEMPMIQKEIADIISTRVHEMRIGGPELREICVAIGLKVNPRSTNSKNASLVI